MRTCPGSKFTLLFERLAIDWVREAAVTAVARQLKLGWDAVWGIERRAVARGLERRGTVTLRYVGVDEKSFQRRHDYVTVVSDLEGSRVLLRRRLCPTGVTLSIGGGPDGGQARAAGDISLARAQ